LAKTVSIFSQKAKKYIKTLKNSMKQDRIEDFVNEKPYYTPPKNPEYDNRI
jgi:hypothetical protein